MPAAGSCRGSGRKISVSTRMTSRNRSRTSTANACRSASASCSTRAAAWTARRWRRHARRSTAFSPGLLDPEDEVFLYRFDSNPMLVEGWTRDKRRLSMELGRLQPRGGTALYDAVAEAVPLAQSGRNRKKALVIISDGNDTSSRTDVLALKQMIRETEVLVYAVGIDTSRRRLGCRRTGSHVTPSRSARAVRGRRACRCRFRSRSRRPRERNPPPPAPPTFRSQPRGGGSTSRGRRRTRQRGRAARHHRRQRRPHRDRPRRARSRSGHGRHRRRVEPAVLPRATRQRVRRTAAGTRSASRCAIRRYHVRARRGYRSAVS